MKVIIIEKKDGNLLEHTFENVTKINEFLSGEKENMIKKLRIISDGMYFFEVSEIREIQISMV